MNKIEDLVARKTAIYQGNAKAIEKQHAGGKLTARERLGLLFDPGTFVEMDTFVTHRCTYFDMPQKHQPTDGVVCGYGKVDGRVVFAYAQDFTIMGGSLGEMQANKICHVLEAARKVGAPVVGMNDSGGARIQEGIDGLSGYGKIFFRNTAASGVVPQITAIMGPCAGGAVYSPALTDFIKTVTGEVVTGEDLGGATTHNKKSGVAHFMTQNDQDCIAQIKRLLSFLPSNWKAKAPEIDFGDDPYRLVPELATILPDNANRAYNMYDVIRGIVDRGDYMLRAHQQAGGRHHRQPAEGRRGLPRHQRLRQGRAVHPHLRRVRPAAAHHRRRARLPARHPPGVRRHHPPRRQDALRLQRGHRAQGHPHPEEGLRRRLPRDVLPGARRGRLLRVA